MKNNLIVAVGAIMFITLFAGAQIVNSPKAVNNGGLTLPGGFSADVIADTLPGKARHLAVNAHGDIFVKMRFPDSIGGNLLLQKAGDKFTIQKFGNYYDKGSYGTAMRIHNGYLYFSSEINVYRMRLNPETLLPEGAPELIVHDADGPHEHDAKPIAFDHKGHLYVAFGAASNACQEQNRVPGSLGIKDCPLLKTSGGIWQFDEAKTGQLQKDGIRYATGLRSVVAMDWNDTDNCLYVVAHGRDDLHLLFPEKYSSWQSAVKPAEEFLKIRQGANVGWPYYYYDPYQHKKVLNPEYEGSGKQAGNGAKYTQPLLTFPAHWAPNDLLFYKGTQLPAHYRNGAFVAFHGSTNRSPYPQTGFCIAFVPFKNGKPAGPWELFADGFAGKKTIISVSEAEYRPMGLAEGPDGSLYVSDTEKGRIWRIFYSENKTHFGIPQLRQMAKLKNQPPYIEPHPINDDKMQGVIGTGAFLYQYYCISCHQPDGKGDGNLFPPLAGSEWVTGGAYMEKDMAIGFMLKGFQGPLTVLNKPYNNVMPSFSQLSDADIASILTYIRNNFDNHSSLVTAGEVQAIRSTLPVKK